MSSQICLKWNSFLSNIATSFESLWEEEGLVDVTLASDGQCLTAHKVILSASSPFFKKVFQTNPCQHPVIILQDVRFTELEALLIFIYKGEVNIEQKNLPALLKAAETLQIRGLSGGDIFAKESYKRLAELEQEVADDAQATKEETPKKKQKVFRQQQCNSGLDIASEPRMSRTESTEESVSGEQGGKEVERVIQNVRSDLSYGCPETKMEPTDTGTEDPRRCSPVEKDPAERLDTGQMDGSRGPSKPGVRVIAEAREASAFSTSSPEPFCPRERSPDRPRDRCREVARDRLGDESPDHPEDKPEGREEDQPEDEAQQPRSTFSIGLEVRPAWKDIAKFVQSSANLATDSHPDTPEVAETIETTLDEEECCPPNVLSERNARVLRPPFPACTGLPGNSDFLEEGTKGGASAYPPFPCPFCDRAYTSWGFRRRHIKAVHTISPSLNCKWCLQVLPSHAAWRRHVISAHNLSASDAHNGLLILEEAHMVLQIARPTRLDTLVNIIKQSSQQNSARDNSQLDKD